MNIEYRRHSFQGATLVEIWDADQKNPLKACKGKEFRGYGDVEQITEKEILALISQTKNKYRHLKSIIVYIWGQEL